MPVVKPERAFGVSEFRKFPGINAEKVYDGMKGASEMINFRLCTDGSLEKRHGYDSALTLPGVPRAVFSGCFEGEEALYFLVHDKIYKREAEDEYGYLYCGTVVSTAGEAEFAEYFGKLYLFDGDEIYVKTGAAFKRVEGYIPLYGDGWDPDLCGAVFETENLLTPRVRIRYDNESGASSLRFGRRVRSIDRILLDGVEPGYADVVLSATGRGCTSSAFASAECIELLVTLDCTDRRGEITGCTRAFAYGDAQKRRLFCLDRTDGAHFYCSSPVSRAEAEYAEELGGCLGGGLYFPVSIPDYRLDAPVTAVCRYFDRLLIFTASGAWAADDTEHATVTQISASIGCDKEDGAVLCGNTPITYFGGKLWAWSAKSDARNEYSARVISMPVAETVAAMRNARICMQYYPEPGELWLSNPLDKDGSVLVYNAEQEAFYRFSGVWMDRAIASAYAPQFLSGAELMVFGTKLYTDVGGREIAAVYRSGYLDFGHPERPKHLLGFFLEATTDGGEVTLRFSSDRGEHHASVLRGGRGVIRRLHEGRAAVGRFRYLSFSLETKGESRPRIAALTVSARK